MSTPNLLWHGLQGLSTLSQLPPLGGKQAPPGSFFFKTPPGGPVPSTTASEPCSSPCPLCGAGTRRHVRVSEHGTFQAYQCLDSECSFSRHVKARLDGYEQEAIEASCDHAELDHGVCCDCGADRTEWLMARAYDRAKDSRKYGD